MDIYIARTISGKAAAAFRAGRSLLILPAAAALLAAAPALGQETVYIGGSGQTSVDVDLGVLDRFEAPRRVEFGLRHPGIVADRLPPVKLHPPGEGPAAVAASAEAMAPVESVAKLEPAPAPEPTAPEPQAAPEPAPRQMTEEARAAAIARNKDSVSATAFANEAALGAGNDTAAPEAAAGEAAPKVAAKAAPKSAPTSAPESEMAALDPADLPIQPGQTMQIAFAAGETALPHAAQAPLAALAARLNQDDTLRLQLRAYAGSDGDSASHARRLSLSRALAVRSHLIERGVRSTRIDVRALGNKSENGTSDRVDVILVKR